MKSRLEVMTLGVEKGNPIGMTLGLRRVSSIFRGEGHRIAFRKQAKTLASDKQEICHRIKSPSK